MIRSFCRRSSPLAAAVAAALLVIFLSSCAVPLAPGFQIQKESLSVRFVAGNPPHLAIRAEYRLANVGNASLHFFDLTLPGEKGFGRANLRAQINGKDLELQPTPGQTDSQASGSLWRVALPSRWRQKEKITLVVSYDLAAHATTDPRISVARNTFYLNDSGWFPQLLGFKALFAAVPVRPNPTTLGVVIPADFRVTASGRPHGTKKQAGEVDHPFLIRTADFPPYVLAGQYNEQRVSADGVTVAIWTLKPISGEPSQKNADPIAAAAKFYARTFSPLPKDMESVFDVENPGNPVPSGKGGEESVLPGVVNRWSSTPDDSSAAAGEGSILPLALDEELAYTWFGHMMRPSADAWPLSGTLETYAARAASGQDTASNRLGAIVLHLAFYDGERTKAVEKPILSLTSRDQEDQLRIGAEKMQLFSFALEDKCGQQNVTHAISDMVYALRGQEYGYSDFRAALEQDCRQNLADFFRSWLAQPGIPPEFRARYENAGAK